MTQPDSIAVLGGGRLHHIHAHAYYNINKTMAYCSLAFDNMPKTLDLEGIFNELNESFSAELGIGIAKLNSVKRRKNSTSLLCRQ